MTKAVNKTRETDASVDAFLAAVEGLRGEDARQLKALMDRLVDEPARLWGSSIIGYGRYHYRTKAGRDEEFFLTGFSPRKQALTVYIMPGFGNFEGLLTRLGPHSTSKSCLYIKRLDAIETDILGQLVTESVAIMRSKFPA